MSLLATLRRTAITQGLDSLPFRSRVLGLPHLVEELKVQVAGHGDGGLAEVAESTLIKRSLLYSQKDSVASMNAFIIDRCLPQAQTVTSIHHFLHVLWVAHTELHLLAARPCVGYQIQQKLPGH